MTIRTYSTVEVAEQIMGCSERWLVAQLRSRRFPGRKVGRRWRMTDRDIQDALDTCSNDARRNVGNVGEPLLGLTPTSRRRAVPL
jgi:hypothetical protein